MAVAVFLPPLMSPLSFSSSSPCSLTLSEAAGQRGCHPVDLNKKKKKKGEGGEEERGSVCGALFRSWSCFRLQVIHTQAELGSSALPFTSAGQLLQNNTEAFIRPGENGRGKGGRVVCIP